MNQNRVRQIFLFYEAALSDSGLYNLNSAFSENRLLDFERIVVRSVKN